MLCDEVAPTNLHCSYKDQTVIEPFSPKTNVVVGRNGSGKSNFFAAIRFVLSDAYTQMGREERQGLLHEGSGSAVMQAYVEIIFDNSDDRFPTGGKEVTLRRSIGLKKDEYSVDKKVVTKSDVMNLLEAAGFSRSNPYYIVPQGRVTALTNMKESDRLNLLKEVAGTQVYEARRAESLKIMNETNNKREKIDELLEYIKERLAELEEEKEELRGFQDTDRERRCLEYAYHHQEQVSVQEHLNQIDNSRQGGLENADSSRAAFLEGEKQIDKLEAQIHKLERDMHLLQIERSQLEEDRRDSAKSLAQAELKTRSLQDGQSAQEQAQIQHEAELQGVRADIANKEAELQQILPNYNRQKESEDGIAKQLLEAQSARDLLLSKQGRGSRFTNKTERDNWLKQEIKELRSNLNVQNGNMIDVEADIKGIEQSIANGESTLAEHRSTLGNWNINRAQIVDEVNAAINKGQRLNDERKLLRREQDKLNTIISDARQEKDVADREMASAIDGATARGLASIRRLKEDPRQNIPGAYGTLAELLEVNEAYRLPVEQIAGASLFHYVVDNADTATYLADTLHKQRGGRVTFMPLAQLRPRHINLPRSNDAVPLLSKLTYDPMFEKAFQQVFGKVVVCPNLAVAGQYARSHGVDGITVEGDTTNKRGAMTGGYIDPKKSRLVAIQGANRCRQELDRLNAQSVNLRDQIDTKDQDVTSAATDLNKVESKLRQTDASLDPLKAEMRNLRGHIDFQRSQLDDAMKRRDTTQRNINTFLQEVSAHEAELGTEFKHSLSAAEEQRLEQQSFVAQDLQRQWNEKSRARRELQQQKQFLETELRQNLPMRLDQLNSQALEFPSSGGKSGSLAEAQRELKKAQAAVKAAETTLHETETEIDNLASQIEAKSTEKFNLEQTQQGLSAEIEKQQKRMDKTLQQKALLTSQAAECAKNIRDLGALPEEAFDKYENMETTTVSICGATHNGTKLTYHRLRKD